MSEAIIAPIRALVEGEQFEQALNAIAEALPSVNSGKEKELWAMSAWCRYKRGEFALALKAARSAGKQGKETLAELAQYAVKFCTTDEEFQFLVAELGSDPRARVAAVTRARDKASLFNHSDVILFVRGAKGSGVVMGDLFLRAGQFFVEKNHHGFEDSAVAHSFLETALRHYGTGRSFDRRAEAEFSRSIALEKLYGRELALGAAERSQELFQKALDLDPHNVELKQHLADAKRRVADLRS